MTWKTAVFTPLSVAASTNTEFNIATAAELDALTLGRGTVAVLYGRMTIQPERNLGIDATVSGAWGITLKDEDAAASLTAFAPLVDGDSTRWMTWRGFSLLKVYAAATTETGAYGAIGNDFMDFVIRNPRKIQRDEELVMMFQNSALGAVVVCFWIRVGILLP